MKSIHPVEQKQNIQLYLKEQEYMKKVQTIFGSGLSFIYTQEREMAGNMRRNHQSQNFIQLENLMGKLDKIEDYEFFDMPIQEYQNPHQKQLQQMFE